MRTVCTGGCGFLGSNLVSEALRAGHDVWVYDNLSRLGSRQNLDRIRQDGLTRFTEGDVRDNTKVGELIRDARPDVVFHVAGQVAMTTSIADPIADAAVNIIGTMNVLEAMRRFAPDAAVIYSSTNKVYGDLEWANVVEEPTRYATSDFPRGFDESTPLDFRSPYGCSKGSADQYVLDYARLFGIKGIVFRHSSMYGDRQYATADQGWVGWFVAKALEIADSESKTGAVTVSGNGKQVRDMLHAADMVRLYMRAAEMRNQLSGEAFNIGGGQQNSLSIIELLAFLSKRLGCSITINSLPWRASDQRVFVADITKAERLLGWSPHVSARDGLLRMIDWVRAIS